MSAKIISRSTGRNAVNAAAYRRGVEMFDGRSASTFNYERKEGIVHSELTIPEGSPSWVRQLHELHKEQPVEASERLWNQVEENEKRADAQLARELELALPRELTADQRKTLVREFVTEQLAGRGMIADWSVHHGRNENPHAHIMLTMRPLTKEGFGSRKVPVLDPDSGQPMRDGRGKIRYAYGDAWGSKEDLKALREKWAEYQNFHLALNGHEIWVDHRSFKEQGIDLVPTSHVGVHAQNMEERGKPAERVAEHDAERIENAKRITERPEHVFELITHRQAVFSLRDVETEISRYVDDPDAIQDLMARLANSSERVQIVAEERNEHGRVIQQARYSTRDMLDAERRMVDAAERMAASSTHHVDDRHVQVAFERQPYLSEEQRAAVLHMTGSGGIATVAGYAGAGKSTTLAAAREAWEAQGFRVRGAALAGKAADGLHESAGIESRTIHSLEYAWKNGKDKLTRRDVLVIDEAGMVGSRQLGRVLEKASQAGAKVVLVGDARQLQPIEAGAAFRAIAERVGVAEIATIRRQRAEWARQASQDFAKGDVKAGLAAYEGRGHVRSLSSREAAKEALARDWMAGHQEGSSIILAHTNQDVQDLNQAIRGARREAGQLGQDAPFAATKGDRLFATGDRLVFLENNRELGVKNGMLATVEEARPGELKVKLDNGEKVQVDQRAYANVDHGYAVTVHKAQGATVDRAYVLASGGMDRHLTYVAMTRHRDAVTLYTGRDDFKDQGILSARLGRPRPKETSLDFAERRGIDTPRSLVENARAWVERGRERLSALWHRAERAMEAIRDRYGPGKAKDEAIPPPTLPRHQPTPQKVAEASGREQPKDLDGQQRLAEGEKLEAQWAAILAKEKAAVKTKAARIEPTARKLAEKAHNRLIEHQKTRPQEPRGLAARLGGQGKYEQAMKAWSKEHQASQRQASHAQKRVDTVREYSRDGVPGYPSKGEQLAQRKAERQNPELAKDVREIQALRTQQRAAQQTREFENKRQKEREQGKDKGRGR